MTPRRTATLRIAVIVAGLALVALLAFALERVEETVPGPPGVEARLNAFLAAERFLNGMGLPARSRRSLMPLPGTDQILLIGPESRAIGIRQADELVGWVAAGGHLIVGPHLVDGRVSDATHSDPLLAALGIGVYPLEGAPDEGGRVEFQLDLDGSGDPANVRFYADHGLAFLSEEDSENSYNVVYDDLGEGRFYVLNDTRFLWNDEIGELDHARMLWDIVQFGGPRAGALVIFGGTHESLLSLLLRHAWPALLACAACLGALAWRNASRFGPLLSAPVAGSRSLMDHIDAAGHFFWRQRRTDVLLDGARRSLLRQAGLRRPQLARMDEAEAARVLATGTQLDAKAVQAALFGVCPNKRDAFTRCMRTLETLRSSL